MAKAKPKPVTSSNALEKQVILALGKFFIKHKVEKTITKRDTIQYSIVQGEGKDKKEIILAGEEIHSAPQYDDTGKRTQSASRGYYGVFNGKQWTGKQAQALWNVLRKRYNALEGANYKNADADFIKDLKKIPKDKSK